MVDSGGKISQYIYDHMDKTDDNRIATAEEVLQTLTKILRMELYETNEEINPVTGEVVELKNSPKLSDVNRSIDAKVDYTLKVSAELDQMKDDKLRCLLRDRYICCKSWEQIAVDMGYVIRRVYQLHGEALKEFRELYPDKFG